jgi:hypothetical protein
LRTSAARRLTILAVTTLAAAGLSPRMMAADPFYLGTWKITSAVVAPWADPAVRKPDQVEMKSLVGKIVVFKPGEITGPRQVACKGPKYKAKDYPADMLFQGAFGEMKQRDKSVDPVKIAARLGFQGSSWKTVETGCETELDWHFIDPTTTTFGLNDWVYTLRKQ